MSDGFLRLPHSILRRLMRCDWGLTGRERAVFLAVLEDTLAWSRPSHPMSNSRIAEKTGLDRSHARRTLAQLEARKMVTVTRANRRAQVVAPVLDPDLWLAEVGPKWPQEVGPKRPQQDGVEVGPKWPQEVGPKRPHSGGAKMAPIERKGKEKEKELGGARARAAARRRCPDEWEPKPADWQAWVDWFGEDLAGLHLDRMRAHEFQRPYTDWHRVAGNWMRRERANVLQRKSPNTKPNRLAVPTEGTDYGPAIRTIGSIRGGRSG